MMEKKVYQWSRKDKALYALSMLPFVVVFLGTAYLLATYSFYLALVLVGLYLLTNIFQAGCCVGCPYRGSYCPALCGVYLGNLLSTILYKDRQFDAQFFKRNATAGEIMLILTVLFPLYWIFQTGWYLVPLYLLLLGAHFLIFMPTQCEKCSYNSTCPGGQTWLGCRKWLDERRRA
jgi:hypothetical protein